MCGQSIQEHKIHRTHHTNVQVPLFSQMQRGRVQGSGEFHSGPQIGKVGMEIPPSNMMSARRQDHIGRMSKERHRKRGERGRSPCFMYRMGNCNANNGWMECISVCSYLLGLRAEEEEEEEEEEMVFFVVGIPSFLRTAVSE